MHTNNIVSNNRTKHPIIKQYVRAPTIDVELIKELISLSIYKIEHITIKRITTYLKNTGTYSLIMDTWKPFLNR